MKKILFLFLLLAVAQVAAAVDHVIITEVLYNPTTTETGTEAVQIYNPTNNSVNIGSWVVRTESSQADATIPANTLLQSGQYYLIADANWSQSKNEEWPLADHEEAMVLANTDAGVVIVNNNTIIDAVGWGDAVNIDAGLYEGSPANDSGEGKSLQRKMQDGVYVDANNNYNDFFAATPKFAAGQGANEIKIIAIVTGAAPEINKIVITDDDSTVAGFQVIPNPAGNKTATITAIISDANGNGDVANVTMNFNSKNYQLQKTFDNSSTTAKYEANISLPFYLPPRNYSIKITATDTANFSTTANTSFEYQGIVAMEFDTNTLVFNAMPGTTAELVGDKDMSTDNTTIRNIGNTALSFKLSATNLITGQSIIPAGKLQYSFGTNDYKPLSTSQQTEGINLQPASNAVEKLSLKLAVPTGTTPGNYTGKISLVAVTHDSLLTSMPNETDKVT